MGWPKGLSGRSGEKNWILVSSGNRTTVHGTSRPCLLTPWSRVLLEKLTGSQLVKKFPAFCGTRNITNAWLVLRLRMEERPPICKVAANILNGQPTRDGLPAWELGELLTTLHRKNWPCYERVACASGPQLSYCINWASHPMLPKCI